MAESKLSVPSVSIVMPTTPAEPALLVPVEPLKAPSTELRRASVVGSPSSGPAVPAEVPEPGVKAVSVLRSVISWLAAVTRVCTVVAIVWPSGWSEMVVCWPGSASWRSMVTPGIRPLMSLESLVTVKAPGPLPTVIWALAAAVTVVSWPIPEKALVAILIVLSAPGEVDCTDRLNWLAPVLMADADTPTPAELIASTTELRLPLPVLTSAAVIDPTETGPVNVAVTVDPFAPFRRDRAVGREIVEVVRDAVNGYYPVGAVGHRGGRARKAKCRSGTSRRSPGTRWRSLEPWS